MARLGVRAVFQRSKWPERPSVNLGNAVAKKYWKVLDDKQDLGKMRQMLAT